MGVFISLLLGTLVSEDLTCIAAGVLIERGVIGPLPAVVACAFGIFAGDVALWALGRLFGRPVVAWVHASNDTGPRFETLRTSLRGHAGCAILASRFLPGTRVPLYLVAGLIGVPGRVFSSWALVATAVWTPVLVLASEQIRRSLTAPVSRWATAEWTLEALLAILMFGTLRAGRQLARWSLNRA